MKLQYHPLSLLALAISCGVAFGQSASQSQELSVPQQCALRMIEQPVIRKLNLSPAQSRAFQQAEEAYVSTSKKLDADKKASDLDRAMCDRHFANACLSVLNPEQKHLILQITIPAIGIRALTDPAIATRVGLSPTQAKKVGDICGAMAKSEEDVSAMVAEAIVKIPLPKPGTDRRVYDKKCAQVSAMYNGERQRLARERADADAKVLALMTPAQQAKWLDLEGKH